MATQKLEVIPTIKEGIAYGLKNIPSLLGMTFLYLITIWIPYLNVGTTIGLCKSIIKIGRGEVINPLDIFKAENFKNLGDFFLLLGLIAMGVGVAFGFMIIPGLVVSIAWGFAVYFFIDKGLSPTKCLKVSWKVTDGEKWTIFWIILLTCIIFCVLIAVLFSLSTGKLGWFFTILGVVGYLLMFAAIIAVDGVMYRHFSEKADEMLAE